MLKSMRLFLALGLMALLSACSVDGSITDVTRRTFVPKVAESTGLISASQQNQTTTEGYKISTSVGAPISGQLHQVSPEGYIIHSNVQGNISSETYDVIVE